MEKFIEKNEDGTLTDEQTEKFMLQIAATVRNTFKIFGQLEDEDILQAYREPTKSEAFVGAVNQGFEMVVEADLPQGFNDYLGQVATQIMERAFKEINEKNQENLITMIETSTGLDYGDMSPKDIIEYIIANKKIKSE